MNTNRPARVGIIGAGVAGLATARQLVSRDIDCTVFERGGRLGGVWSIGYAGFGAQVQKELYEFPDYPLPDGTPDFTPGETLQAYLEGYARHFGVWERIRFGANVVELREGAADGRRWTLVTEGDGEARREETFDVVVMAVGLYSHTPHVPEFPGRERFGGEVMHVSELRDRDQLTGKRVVVVGFGKSATDAAIESAAVADRTSLVFREPHWPVPQKLLGLVPFKWAMLSRLTSALIPQYYEPSRAERTIHTLGRPLVWLWWRIVELLLIGQHRLGSRRGRRVSLVPSTPVEVDTLGEATMLPRPQLYRLLRNGGIDPHRTRIAAFTETGVRLADGRTLGADTVVMGTGWSTRPAFLSDALRARIGLEDDGCYLYRQIVHPDVPWLAFVGNAATIQNIATYSIQARWLAELIEGSHRLPDAETMRRDIDRMRAWKRSVMPYSSARGARLLLHMLHYHDQLLVDMGVDPRRKQGLLGPFKEVFAPYECADYRPVVATG
ncbi:MAG TPA: FAD-dependent oxidoreductase [Longimicrobiales bacterium]|nr:FAD-dependent oxidoreductase [Longimicrobiales bacterium]